MLENKILVVTGGGSGMGRAAAITLAAHGATVIVADRNVELGQQTAQTIAGQNQSASFAEVDIASEDSVRNLMDIVLDQHGRLDGAFNNAGIEMAFQRIHEISSDVWNRAIGINLTGTFLCMKYEIAAMLRSGGGAIVNTASVLGQVGGVGVGDYAAAKHGIIGLTRSAAADYGTDGIRINAILPGTIETPMVMERAMANPAFKAGLEGNRARHLMKRFGRPEEIGEVVAWLLSDHASFVTGAAMPVDGGYLAN